MATVGSLLKYGIRAGGQKAEPQVLFEAPVGQTADYYLVALELEDRRDSSSRVSLQILQWAYNLPVESYTVDDVVNYLIANEWVQLSQNFIGQLTLTETGALRARELIDRGLLPKFKFSDTAGDELTNDTLVKPEDISIDTTISDLVVTAIPASDRIVAIDDNIRQSIGPDIAALIEKIETSEAPRQEPHIKEEILVLLRSGQEFIRLGGVKWEILQLTLFNGVERAKDRYLDQVIVKLAADIISKLFFLFAAYLFTQSSQ